MNYGICPLSVVPVRATPVHTSEMVSQLLYGEHFTVLGQQGEWIRIRIAFDGYEGWISGKQFIPLTEENYQFLENHPLSFSGDLIEFSSDAEDRLIPILLGSHVSACPLLVHQFEGAVRTGKSDREALVETASLYLNTPYLWGGKSPFGVDCSGFTQMVYKINGYSLLRDASQQAQQGEVLNFIEEAEVGDLAFFDNEEGKIVHVGILLGDNRIIHASGKVRIDGIDHTGIFNAEMRTHSHRLRVIKKIF